MRHRTFSLAGLFCLASVALAGFDPTPVPAAKDGTPATVDLPANRHIRNVGGSDGAGLCVFTSVQHSADWQNVRELDGFREWMRRRPGGGWPEKLDQMLVMFAREKGVAVPVYIQHTGGDESFLDLALKTDRFPSVTYAGRDDFYRGRIAHMVNLAHLDGEKAAILDNNRPGVWLWMTRAEFLSRWRDMNGGWVVVLLAPPPPPHAEKPQAFGAAPCVCGDDCRCAENGRQCPGGCAVFGQADWRWQKQCGPDGCKLVKVSADAPRPIGNPPGLDFEWKHLPNVGWGWVQVPKAKAVQAPAPQLVEAAPENFGVDTNRIHAAPRYSINGVEVSKASAHAAVAGGLSDDSDRWHLTAVGDPAFLARFKADVADLPADVRGKLLVQSYGLEDWPVKAFGLLAGVSLRKPSPARTAPEIGWVQPDRYDAAALRKLLSAPGGPASPAPPGPSVRPAPGPSPDGPAKPADGVPFLALLAAAVALLVSLFRRKVHHAR